MRFSPLLAMTLLLSSLSVIAGSPVAVDDSYTTSWDNRLTVLVANGVLANDSDPDGDALESHIYTLPSTGYLSLSRDGSFAFQPQTGVSGDIVFRYKAWDGHTFTVATVAIHVTPGNRAPISNPDSYTTNWDTALTVDAPGVLGNDSDPDGDVLEAHIWENPARGHLILYRNGSFVYRPEVDYEGDVTFQYKAWDGRLKSINTVTIHVTAGNHTPIAVNDTYYLGCDGRFTVPAPGIMANDSDPDGNPLVTSIRTQPSVGSLGMGRDGSFYYDAPAGFQGVVTFEYRLEDVPSIRRNQNDRASKASSLNSPNSHYAFATVTLVISCTSAFCPGSAYLDSYGGWGGNHSFYLVEGMGTDFNLMENAQFVENPDGTAVLTGTIRRERYPNRAFNVVVNMSGKTYVAPPGSPKRELKPIAYVENGGPINVGTYYYYTEFSGTLSGIDQFAGAIVNISRRGPAFQVGLGASGKNLNFGGSAWFDWTLVQQGTSYTFSHGSGVGDINIDITDCH